MKQSAPSDTSSTDSTNDKVSPDRKKVFADRLLLWWAIWSIVGMAVPVIAYTIGVLLPNDPTTPAPWVPDEMLTGDILTISPAVLFLLTLSATTYTVYNLLKLHGAWLRWGILVCMVVLIAMASPICAIWNVNFNTFGMFLAILISGIGATITATIFQRKSTH